MYKQSSVEKGFELKIKVTESLIREVEHDTINVPLDKNGKLTLEEINNKLKFEIGDGINFIAVSKTITGNY